MYRKILIIGGFGAEKNKFLINLINYQSDIVKIDFHVKDSYEAKYQ